MSSSMLPSQTTTLGQAHSFTQLYKGLSSRTITLGQEPSFTRLYHHSGSRTKLHSTIPSLWVKNQASPDYTITLGQEPSFTRLYHHSGSRTQLHSTIPSLWVKNQASPDYHLIKVYSLPCQAQYLDNTRMENCPAEHFSQDLEPNYNSVYEHHIRALYTNSPSGTALSGSSSTIQLTL
ncbi:hypothetical protein BsWGS_19334 [Bradybaena similaris]